MFSWRAGFKINLDHDNIIRERAIICMCYKWEHEDEVHSLQWDKGDDRQMLEDFSMVAGVADEIVGHNAAKFDLKWFNTRNLYHDLPPVPDYKVVDTLHIARRHFYLNSNRLDYLGKLLFGEGKIKTEFNLWKRITLDNDPQAMDEMIHYCKGDVLLLEKVYKRLAPYSKPKTHAGVASGEGRWSCPGCGSEDVIKSKTRISAMGIKQHQMFCKSCFRYYSISDLVFRQYAVYRAEKEIA